MADTHEAVVQKIIDLYHMLFCHNGFGEMSVDIRILKRGQKEVILRCGKQYRFVVDAPGPCGGGDTWMTDWKHDEDEASWQAANPAAARGVRGGNHTPPAGGATKD